MEKSIAKDTCEMNGFGRQCITNPCNRKIRIWCFNSSKGWKQTVDLMKSGNRQSSNRGRPHCSGWNSSSECSIESAMEYESDSFWSDGTATTFILAAFPALTPTLLKTRNRKVTVSSREKIIIYYLRGSNPTVINASCIRLILKMNKWQQKGHKFGKTVRVTTL